MGSDMGMLLGGEMLHLLKKKRGGFRGMERGGQQRKKEKKNLNSLQ